MTAEKTSCFKTKYLKKFNDEYANNFIRAYSKKYFIEFFKRGEEIDKICDFITVKYLVREKKKNYC